MTRTILLLGIGGFFMALGLWGGFLALKLMQLAAEDRGTLRAVAGTDQALLIVANKMLRLAYNRFAICSFVWLVGLIALLGVLEPEPETARDGISLLGWILIGSIAAVGALQVWITIKDLEDRDAVIALSTRGSHE